MDSSDAFNLATKLRMIEEKESVLNKKHVELCKEVELIDAKCEEIKGLLQSSSEVSELEKQIELLEKKLISASEKEFAGFCKKYKIPSLSYFENNQLRNVEAANEKRMKFVHLISKLKNQ